MLLPGLLGQTQALGTPTTPQEGTSGAAVPEPSAEHGTAPTEQGAPPAGLFKKTMMGMAPGVIRELDYKPIGIAVPMAGKSSPPSPAAEGTVSPVRQAPAPFQTMSGMAPEAPSNTPLKQEPMSPTRQAPAPFQTMLGMAPEAPSTTPPEQEPLSPAQQSPAPFQTMLGMAPMVPGMPPSNEAKQTLLGAGSISEPEVKQVLARGSKKETLIGVAVPGIAPIKPGVDKNLEPVAVGTEPQLVGPVNEPPSPGMMVAQPAVPGTRRYLALSLAVSACVLAAISTIAIWWWKSTPRLVVQVRTDEAGRDSLELDCPNCSDGSEIALADTSTSFKSRHASIPLKAPLKMGDNSVQLLLSRSGARPEKIQLSVPVEYRVTGDTSGLDETPPKLRLLFEKLPNVAIEVAQQPVVFDPSGHGHYDIDVTNDLVGPSSVEKPLERRVLYQVKTTAGTTEGAVNIRTAILPLNVDSPGPLLVTDREEFKLCGTTAPSANVNVAGLGIGVDGSGHFCHAMIIKEVGKFPIWITAIAKGFAPRKIQRVIERNSNLAAYAKKLYGEVPHDLEKSLTSAGAGERSLVAISGTIIELSESPPITRALLQLGTKHDSQGFARIVASNQPALPAGHTVTVFGQVTGTLKGPDGRDMHELSAAFIVPGVP